MRKFATYIVAKPGVAPGTMLKPGYCRASFIIGIALAYGHKKSPKNGAFVYKSVYKFCKSLIFKVYCGETGIRTPGTSRYNGFQDRRNRPLCHLSKTLRESCLVFQRRCKGTHYFEICKYLPPFLIIFFHCRTFASRKNETN